MNNNGPVALIVEDDPPSRQALARIVGGEGFGVETASSIAEARERVANREPTLILSDLVLPDGTGLELINGDGSPAEIVFITGQATVDTVITALRRGARDYLTKPVDVDRLKQILGDVKRAHRGAAGDMPTIADADRDGSFGQLVGRSPAMLKLYEHVRRVAPTQATVLLLGDTGTGKELVARTIHDLSDRRNEAFVPLNCGAVSSTLIESELFGHEKGSFTGASRRHIGVFERAHEGTLFLDEITEMPAELQVKLLRVLESRQFQRVGGEQYIDSRARLIAATNRAPEEAVREGKLREDLFYRLQVFPIFLPPLAKRGADIGLLARNFLALHNAEESKAVVISDAAIEWLTAQPWPGNVRELRNVIHRAFILADREIEVEHLRQVDQGDGMVQAMSAVGEVRITVGSTIAAAERELIEATLRRFRNDKKKAARVLGISLKTLYTRLAVYRGDGGQRSGGDNGAVDDDELEAES
jgi:two-component system response regulator AtoC